MNINDGTNLGGARKAFPSTKWTMIRNARDPSSPDYRRALDELCTLYWKPVYAFIRSMRETRNEDAKDLAQDFLTQVIEGELLARFSPDRGSFRAYLRGALRLHLLEHQRDASAQKRGGDRKMIPLEDEELRLLDVLAEKGADTPEQQFDRQWANALLDHAVEDLKRELAASGRAPWFTVFARYDLGDASDAPTYGDLAAQLGLKESDVSNYLMFCRRRMRELIVERIRDYVDSDAEIAAEIADLFSR